VHCHEKCPDYDDWTAERKATRDLAKSDINDYNGYLAIIISRKKKIKNERNNY
jgi:hypothetical protein